MSKDEIDIMWQQAMRQSIEDGEVYTRYHFAKLVAERALSDPMRDVQRLGQEIEQEPVALPCLIDSADFSENTITLVMQCEDYKVSAGTHWLSTTPPTQPAPVQEQEPVAEKAIAEWAARHDIQGSPTDLRCMFEDAASLCTPPAQPAAQRKPLTDEQIFACENSVPDEVVSDRDWCIHFARAIEAAHGIKKNT
jgi:hypothetical protein